MASTSSFSALFIRLPRSFALWALIVAVVVLAPGAAPASAADGDAADAAVNLDFGNILAPLMGRKGAGQEEFPITMEEFKGVSCLTFGSAIATATVFFGGTALAFGSSAASTTAVAMPALAAAMWAGCAFGAAAAPGLSWAARHSERLLLLLVEVGERAVPAAPVLSWPTLPFFQSAPASSAAVANSTDSGPLNP